MYSAGELCNKCIILKQKLIQKNIEFEIKSSVGQLIKLGFKSAPILDVNGELMDFGKAVEWVNKTGDKGVMYER